MFFTNNGFPFSSENVRMIPEAEERVNTLLQEAREHEAAGRSIQAGIARRTAELNQVNGSFKDLMYEKD